MKVERKNNRLVLSDGGTELWIDPWGVNGVRVRMTAFPGMDGHDWALTEQVETPEPVITVTEVDVSDPWLPADQPRQMGVAASLTNGKLTVRVSPEGWLSFWNQKGELLTEEYWRTRDRINRYAVPLRVTARELKPIMGSDDCELTARFEAFDGEMIFGMGQYQDRHLNKKGATLELAQRNSQASVPFYVSSRGYGFLWNNPAIGTATFGTNRTEWHARSTRKLDYYVTAGDTPAEIEAQYASVTGHAPMMPEHGLGYWQCKLRYSNQEEVLRVAREHKRRGLPLDVIVIDFFHWPLQGEFRFDPVDWPDPAAMTRELKAMGIETMVSVWPTVDERSANYGPMREAGHLVGVDRGMSLHGTWMGNTSYFDATHPGAREYVWNCCRKNYYDNGVRLFWLDEAEPEYGAYEFDLFRYHDGPALQCSNIYPAMFAKGFYEGLKAVGEQEVVSLLRCAWAGSQKYGALVWSGDIVSSFRAMREQLQAGLSMGMAGIPWWTCDIGGFLGGHVTDPAFHELLMRWFAWGAFLPVFRMHGERQPHIQPKEKFRDGIEILFSGSDNEVWSFGPECERIMSKFIHLRERLRPYIRQCMKDASETGAPVMRPLLFDFPEDRACWQVEDAYMFGPDLLVAPVMEPGATERTVYLPAGCRWTDAYTGQVYAGGQTVTVPAPMDVIPVMIREGREHRVYEPVRD